MAAMLDEPVNGARQPIRSEFASGPWPKILLLMIILGMAAGFIAGFWVGILGLCFGAALIAGLHTK